MKKIIDLLLINGKIITFDNNKPEVEAVAIDDGKIIEIGTTQSIADKFNAKKTVDLKGRFVSPGFNDAHTHLIGVSANYLSVNLANVTSPDEALKLIKKRIDELKPGEWLFGENWDESNWSEKRFLTLEELDKISPKNPCYIRRVCGHLVAINSLALDELDIKFDDFDLDVDPDTKTPLGYIRDALITRLADSPKLQKSQEEYNKAVKIACNLANSLGVTSVTDNLEIKGLKAYIHAWKNKELTVRVNANIPRDELANFIQTGLITGFGDEMLHLGAVKIFTDGSLGSRTAALKEPYYDSDTTGEFYIQKEEYQQLIESAIKNNWQTATHAIGDEAIDFIIDAFENQENQELVKKGRHRIEHAEYLHMDQLQRIKNKQIILSMQPNFPGRWGKAGQLYETRLGPERYKKLNNLRKILNEYPVVAFGSDNMPMSPIFGIWSVAAHPISDIRITTKEALYCYTVGPAYASFEENIKGSIEPGKVADFVVLDKDILSIDPEEIKDTNVIMTIVAGKIVYEV